MWIAFIFQYLWDTKQRFRCWNVRQISCELLSFFSIFGIQNNSHWQSRISLEVVNCFHFSVSLGYKTTKSKFQCWCLELWIAFIFQYLWDTKQPISVMKNSNSVVNCFHFSVSLGYKTTRKGTGYKKSTLWIAFIFQYLWDTKQLLIID